jgi:hypothetical protein
VLASIASVVIVVGVALAAALASIFLPASAVGEDTAKIAAAGIFAGSYLALAIGKVPGLGIDRAGIALVGACLMVAAGILTPEDAYQAIDLDTLTLLLGIMIVVANLRLSGFFSLVIAWLMRRAGRPFTLLATIVAASGVFSAFLVNDAICLILSPLVLELTLNLKRKPTPYLIALATASNVGSSATITGNPQNILIGGFSRLPYVKFALALTPIALTGLVLTIVLITIIYWREFVNSERLLAPSPQIRAHKTLMIRALMATDHDLPILCRPAARQGSDRHWRSAAADRPIEERADLCGNRLVAVIDVCWVIHHCRGRSAHSPDIRSDLGCVAAAPRSGPSAQWVDSSSVKPCQ